MLVSKNTKSCITPNANPKRESVGLALGMYISCGLLPVSSHWIPNANSVSSGIRAQKSEVFSGRDPSANLRTRRSSGRRTPYNPAN